MGEGRGSRHGQQHAWAKKRAADAGPRAAFPSPPNSPPTPPPLRSFPPHTCSCCFWYHCLSASIRETSATAADCSMLVVGKKWGGGGRQVKFKFEWTLSAHTSFHCPHQLMAL